MPSDGTESADDPDIWKSRMREVQGAIILASLFQVGRSVERCYFGGTDWKVLSHCHMSISVTGSNRCHGLGRLAAAVHRTAGDCTNHRTHWYIAVWSGVRLR